MKPAETKELYEKACRSKRLVPQQDEAEKWHKALRDFDVRDVRAALDAWWSSTATDSRGDLKSRWLPQPGEMIPLVQAEMRKRFVGADEDKELIGWRCRSCRGTVSGYFPVSRNAANELRYCQRPAGQIRPGARVGEICGGDLDVIHCEAVREEAVNA